MLIVTALLALTVAQGDPILRSVKPDTTVVGVGQNLRLAVDAPTTVPDQDLIWTITRDDSTIHQAVGRAVDFVPRESGSYRAEVSERISRQKLTCYFEAIQLAVPTISLPRGPRIAPGGSGAVIVPNQQPIMASTDATASLRGELISWVVTRVDGTSEQTVLTGRHGKSIEFVPGSPGRFKVTAFIGSLQACASPPVTVMVLQELRVAGVARIDPAAGALIRLGDQDIVGRDDRLKLAAFSLPPGVAPDDISWELQWPGGTREFAKGGTAEGAGLELGSIELRARAGAAFSAPVRLLCLRARFVDKDARELSSLHFSRWLRAFDDQGALLPTFPDQDADRFAVEIEDPTDRAADEVTILSVRDNETVDGPITQKLTRQGTKLVTRPMALVMDQADDAHTVQGISDNAAGDPTLLGTLGGSVVVMYRGVTCARIAIGPLRSRTCWLKIHVLRDPKTGRPVIGDGEQSALAAIRARLDWLNTYYSQVGIRFAVRQVNFIDGPSGLVVISGAAAGFTRSGDPGYVELTVGTQTVQMPTEPGQRPLALANDLAQKLRPEYHVDMIGFLGEGNPMHFAMMVRDASRRNVIVRAPKTLRDLRQRLTATTVDLSDGMGLSFLSGELSMEELCLLAAVKDPSDEDVNLFVVNYFIGDPSKPAARAYPEKLYPKPINNCIILNAAAMDDSGGYPMTLARQMLFIFMGDEPQESAPWALNGPNPDPVRNTLNSGKRLSEAIVRALEAPELWFQRTPLLKN